MLSGPSSRRGLPCPGSVPTLGSVSSAMVLLVREVEIRDGRRRRVLRLMRLLLMLLLWLLLLLRRRRRRRWRRRLVVVVSMRR